MLRESARVKANNSFRAQPGHLIRRVYQASTSMFAEECAAFDLTSVQFAALSAVSEQLVTDATRLSESIYLDRSTLGAVLDRLERKALIVRTPSPLDRRIKLLSITAKGSALLRQVVPAVQAVQERLLEPLPVAKRNEFMKLLQELSESHTGGVDFSQHERLGEGRDSCAQVGHTTFKGMR